MWKGPGVREDAKNAALIAGSALVGMFATAGIFGTGAGPELRVHTVHPPVIDQPLASYEMVEPLSGTNRLYGTVHTQRGPAVTGFLRWDRNEGSWSDLLDATKFVDGEAVNQSGIRFGHVAEIQAVGRNLAIFKLRSGQEIGMTSQASDLGRGLRALIVTEASGAQTELEWRDIRNVEFSAVPDGATPAEGRLHGTLTTRSGLSFTGYVAWDIDEIYSTDVLDGEAHGEDYEIPFGAIQSIDRQSSRAARVQLHSGEELVLSGTKDVNRRNGGISISDPQLGQVKVEWDEFSRIEFHGAAAEVSLSDFDGGVDLTGTVLTESGDEIEGAVRWDRDEARTWELLNGNANGVEFHIELSQVALIEKAVRGSRVTLKDGREFHLSGSNDVTRDNRGIVVESGGQSYVTEWNDFKSLSLLR
ncbi:MAG: hypothetical protein ACR2QM_15215 [Longimicrobiales bacterium]